MKKILLFIALGVQVVANSQLKLNYVNPATNEITIKNYGSSAVDITSYRFCALFEYANIAIGDVAIVAGDLNLAADEEVTVSWNAGSGFNTTQSDLGLYLPNGSFGSAASMVDFMQYGAAGQGREGVANTAGLWTAGQFLTGTGPWYYIGDGSLSGLNQWSDEPLVVGPSTDVRINEVDPDQPSTDTQEFIELYGEPNTALDGLVIVLFSGADDLSYASYDLDGMTLDENGFFVLGSSLVPNVDMILSGETNNIQNGADAVALYIGDASAWPAGVPAVITNVVDAMVYGTEDTEDAGLLAALTPGQIQLNATGNDAFSFSRIPDGGEAMVVTNYFVQAPTPGVTNIPLCSGATVSVVSGELTQCSDAVNDALIVTNNSDYGDFYLYILTDANGLIVETNSEGSFDLNPAADGIYGVWGLSYTGLLNAGTIMAGQPATGITSNACFSFSQNSLVVTIDPCSLNNCDGGIIVASNQNTYLSACSDDESDVFTFSYETTGNADSYAYILATTSGTIVEVLAENSLDLNELPVGDYQVHGLSYFTGLDANTIEPGDALSGISTLGACLDLSDNFIEVHVLNCTLAEGCTRLYISEYMEGLSNNKAIEIYNPTPFPVDLSDYDLFAYANGSIDFTSVVALGGTIAPGDVYVIANSQADASVLAAADMTAGLTTFNGNDAIALAYNLEPVDVIGVIGEDPGVLGWQFGNGSTTDHILIRNSSVSGPTMDWALSQGQWIVLPATEIGFLGSHTATPCSNLAYVTFSVSAVQVEENVGVMEVFVEAFNVTTDLPITIDISASSAIADEDFVNIFPTTLTLSPSNTSQIISIEIIDDLLEEDGFEYFTLAMNDDNDLATFVNQSITISIAPSDQDYPLYTIEEITQEDATGLADSLGVFCSITGIVHGINFNPDGLEFTLIQGAGGIKVFDADESFGYTVAEGDSIVVFGEVNQFMGMTEFYPDQIIYIDGNHALEVPTTVTFLSEINESHMVQMVCVELVDETQWIQVGSGFDVQLTDGTNNFMMRVDLNTDLYNNPALQGHFNVIGIGAQLDPNSPYDDGYTFWPRAITDVSGMVIASFEMPSPLVFGDAGASVDFVNNSAGASEFDWDFGDGILSELEVVSHDYSFDFLSDVADITVSLIVTDDVGCSDTFVSTVDVMYTAIEEQANNVVVLYPNPARETMLVTSNEVIRSIVISDMSGRVIASENNINAKTYSFNVEGLNAGVYHMQLFMASGVSIQRFIAE